MSGEPAPSPRRRLEEWSRDFPTQWRHVDEQRRDWKPDRSDWPPCVFLPLERAGKAILAAVRDTGDELPTSASELVVGATMTQCFSAWRMTQGIYRIDPTLYDALIATPITGDVPADVLLYLPEWCVYVETPGMWVPATDRSNAAVLGLWYWLDHVPSRGLTLMIGIDIGQPPPIAVHHIPLVGTISDAIDITLGDWRAAMANGNATEAPPEDFAAAAKAWLPPALSLVLYLCSRAAEISGKHGQPGNPVPVVTRRHGARHFPAPGPRHWDVGVRLGSALRRAMSRSKGDDGTGGYQVRPHVRGAHWHTYVMGPRKDVDPSARRRDLRWMPPIPVAVEDYDELPAVIHRVKADET